MYNMYSRSSQVQYSIGLWIILKKKSVPLVVQPIKGTVLRKMTLFLLQMNSLRVRTPGKVNGVNYSKVSSNLILYTTMKFLFIRTTKIKRIGSHELIWPMITNIHSLLWGKYAKLIRVQYLDTIDSWHDYIKRI